jgi:cytochrome b involved in lipid metabolism
MRVFTREEFNKCVKNGEQLIIAHGYVYDVSALIKYDIHPGSTNAILKRISKDCTRDYDFHRSKKIWKQYRIGHMLAQEILDNPL